MLSAIRSQPAIRAKERIIAWLLFALHALVLSLSVLLLLSPNNVFNRHSGLASVRLNTTTLTRTPSVAVGPSSNVTAPSA